MSFNFKRWFNETVLGRKTARSNSERLTRTHGNQTVANSQVGGSVVQYGDHLHPVTPAMAADIARREAAARRRREAQENVRRQTQRARKLRDEERARREAEEDLYDHSTTQFATGGVIYDTGTYSGQDYTPTRVADEPKNTPDSWGSSPTSYDPPSSYEAPSHSSSSSNYDSPSSGSSYDSSPSTSYSD
jgi:hypothetical protein